MKKTSRAALLAAVVVFALSALMPAAAIAAPEAAVPGGTDAARTDDTQISLGELGTENVVSGRNGTGTAPAQLTIDTDRTADLSWLPSGMDLSEVALAVRTEETAPGTVYVWKITSGPGAVDVESADGQRAALAQDSQIETTEPVLQVTRLALPGVYTVECTAEDVSGRAEFTLSSYAPAEIAADAAAPEVQAADAAEVAGWDASVARADTAPSVAGRIYTGTDTLYATAPNSVEAVVVADTPPNLAVTASGGTGSDQNPYEYAWWQVSYVNGRPAADTAPLSTDSRLLARFVTLPAAGNTVFYACRVRVEGSEAEAWQYFTLRVVAQASFQINPVQTSSDETLQSLQAGQNLTGVSLAVQWYPVDPPKGTNGYTWSIVSCPKNGTIVTDGGTLRERGSITTETMRVSIQRVTVAGRYVVQCVPITDDGPIAGIAALRWNLAASIPSFTNPIPYYSVQDSEGRVEMEPTRQVLGGSIGVPQNSRFSLYVPGRNFGMTDANDSNFQLEWVYRPSSGAAEQQIPAGWGFYGVDSTTLVGGPMTPETNGWAFRLKVTSRTDTGVVVYSNWVQANLMSGTGPTTPDVSINATPAANGRTVTVGSGGNVTLLATVQNMSVLHQANLSYQWYKQGRTDREPVKVAGAVSAQCSILGVQSDQDGTEYWCEVWNGGYLNETGETDHLTLSVNTLPGTVIFARPAMPTLQSVDPGGDVTLTASAYTLANGRITYQWKVRQVTGPLPSGTEITTALEAEAYLGKVQYTDVSNATGSTYTARSLRAGVYEFVCQGTNADNTRQTLQSAGYCVVVQEPDTTPVVVSPAPNTTQYMGGDFGLGMYLPCTAYLPSGETPAYQWQSSSTGTDAGPWADLEGFTDAELRIPRLTEQNDSEYYRCVVTNPQTGRRTVSGMYQLSVWSSDDVPVITMNPDTIEWNIVPGAGASTTMTVYMESAAYSRSGRVLYSQWQYRPHGSSTWLNVPVSSSGSSRAANAPTGISGGVAKDGVSRLTLDANVNSWAPNGYYRCVWTSGAPQRPDSPLVPQEASLPGVLDLTYLGHPKIVTQPVGAYVEVGQEASFSVEVWTGEQDSIEVYTWQVSEDKGKTWRNCITGYDGEGQYTNTFRTYPVTEAMYEAAHKASPGDPEDSLFRFRCVCARRDSDITEVSAEVPLVIRAVPETLPSIVPGSGSSIRITQDGSARYAKGINATRYGTTVRQYLENLSFSPPPGYQIQLLTATGAVANASATVSTGMQLVLVQQSTGNTVDVVTIAIMGDVDGTGIISLSQVVSVAGGFTGSKTLRGAYLQAALLTGGSRIMLSDVVVETRMYRTAYYS